VLAPPEAEPEEPGELGVADELDGLDGLVELPPDGELDEDELEPGLDGVEDEGGVALLPLLDLLPPPSSPHAARPKAKATATARVESFMSPPWLGYELAASYAPGRTPC
jgi:hypothetical protein